MLVDCAECGATGACGFDLTIGHSEFKRRLGNQCFELTMVSVYRDKGAHQKRQLRSSVVGRLKNAVGQERWEEKVKPLASRLNYKRQRAAEMGIGAIAAGAVRGVTGLVHSKEVDYIYSASAPVKVAASGFEVHENQIEDLLLWQGNSPSIGSAITVCASSYSRIRNTKYSLHTLTSGGALAGWCHSHIANEENEIEAEYETGSAVLDGFYLLPAFCNTAACQALIGNVTNQRFQQGTGRTYVVARIEEKTLRSALDGMGFQPVRYGRGRGGSAGRRITRRRP